MTEEQKQRLKEQYESITYQFDHKIIGQVKRLQGILLVYKMLYEDKVDPDDYSVQLAEATESCIEKFTADQVAFSKKIYALEKWKKMVEQCFIAEEDEQLLAEINRILNENKH